MHLLCPKVAFFLCLDNKRLLNNAQSVMSPLNFESSPLKHNQQQNNTVSSTYNQHTHSSTTAQYHSPSSSFSDTTPMWTQPGHNFTEPFNNGPPYSDRQSSQSPPVFTDLLPEVTDNFTDLDMHGSFDFFTAPQSKHSGQKPESGSFQYSDDKPFKPFPEYESHFSEASSPQGLFEVSDKPLVEPKESPFKSYKYKDVANSWSASAVHKLTDRAVSEETTSSGCDSWHWSNTDFDPEAHKSKHSQSQYIDTADEFNCDEDVAVRELSQQLTESLNGPLMADPSIRCADSVSSYDTGYDELPASPGNGITQIWISNLDSSVSSADIVKLAETCGKVQGIQRKTVSYAFVAYESHAIARSAVNKLNGMIFEDRKITVKFAKYNNEDLDKGGDLPSIRRKLQNQQPSSAHTPSLASSTSPTSQTGNTYKVATSRLVLSNISPQTTTNTVKGIASKHGFVLNVVRNSDRQSTLSFKDAIEAKGAASAMNGLIIDQQTITAQQVFEDVSVNVPTIKPRPVPFQPPLLPLPNIGRVNSLVNELPTIKRTVVSLKDAVIDQQYVSRLLKSLVVDEERMKAFCTVIVQEAVQHPTEYTKVCRNLDSSAFQVVTNGRTLPLKRALLTQCQQFFKQILEQVKTTQGHLSGRVFDHEIGVVARSQPFIQLRGLLKFLAELYMQRFIPCSIIFNCVDTLLNGNHLCCLLNVHALLVSVGRYLSQENVEEMDKCFRDVEELSRKYVLPDSVKKLMQDLCNRRKSGFLRPGATGTAS
jgi:hypothetical protein